MFILYGLWVKGADPRVDTMQSKVYLYYFSRWVGIFGEVDMYSSNTLTGQILSITKLQKTALHWKSNLVESNFIVTSSESCNSLTLL
jgi:hypothetical protein